MMRITKMISKFIKLFLVLVIICLIIVYAVYYYLLVEMNKNYFGFLTPKIWQKMAMANMAFQ